MNRPLPDWSDARERFDSHVQRAGPDECWPWTAYRNQWGRGTFGLTGPDGVSGMYLAPRVAWALAHDEDPGDLNVLHSCDRPECVNPAHLRLGTPRDNAQDAIDRGRHHLASRTHCPKGHPYDADNTRRVGPRRFCKECGRVDALRRYYAKKGVEGA